MTAYKSGIVRPVSAIREDRIDIRFRRDQAIVGRVISLPNDGTTQMHELDCFCIDPVAKIPDRGEGLQLQVPRHRILHGSPHFLLPQGVAQESIHSQSRIRTDCVWQCSASALQLLIHWHGSKSECS